MRRFRKQTIVFIIISLYMLAFSVVHAAAESQDYKVYLKLDGIEGEAQAKGYEKWIELQSFSFEVQNNSAAASTASGSGSGASKADPSPIVLNKNFDSSSIPLFLSSVTGKWIEKGQLVFVRADSEDNRPSIIIDLEKVRVSSFRLFETNESIELNYGSIAIKYNMIGPNGKITPITGGWDFMKNQKK